MVRSSSARQVVFALALATGACSKAPPEPAGGEPSTRADAHRGVRITKAPAGDAASVIADALRKAKADKRDLVVYVGAVWCEPCQYFHHAAERGELDQAFPALTLLEFDADADTPRLKEAGYASELIPLFVVPEDDGRASARRFEGSVKGERAVANITPRLKTILSK